MELDLQKILDFHKFESIEFLMPPCNYFRFKDRYDFPATIFYKKVNTDMLKAVKVGDNGKTLYRDGFGVVKDIFSFHGYYYKKRKELEYFEQFGRLVFEFAMLGKDVGFEKSPLLYEDGMTDYMLHYGLENLWEKMGGQYDYKPWKL